MDRVCMNCKAPAKHEIEVRHPAIGALQIPVCDTCHDGMVRGLHEAVMRRSERLDEGA